MTWWNTLNRTGRIACRKHYRFIRSLGLDRAQARLMLADVLWGTRMAHYWIDN